MRKSYGPDGSVTGTSKANQGGCCGCLSAIFALALLMIAIAGIANAVSH